MPSEKLKKRVDDKKSVEKHADDQSRGVELKVINSDQNQDDVQSESNDALEDIEQGKPVKISGNIIADLKNALKETKGTDEARELAKERFKELCKAYGFTEGKTETVEISKQWSKFLSVYYPKIAKDIPQDMEDFFELLLDLYKDVVTLQEKISYWDEKMQFSSIVFPQLSLYLLSITALIDAHYGLTINSITHLNTWIKIVNVGLNAATILLQKWSEKSRNAAANALDTNIEGLKLIGSPLPPHNGPFSHTLQNNKEVYQSFGVFKLTDPTLRTITSKVAEQGGSGSVQTQVLNDYASNNNSATVWKFIEEYSLPFLAFVNTVLGGAQFWLNVDRQGKAGDPSTTVPVYNTSVPTPTLFNTTAPNSNNSSLFSSDKFNTTMLILMATITFFMTVISLIARSNRNSANNAANYAKSSLDSMQEVNGLRNKISNR